MSESLGESVCRLEHLFRLLLVVVVFLVVLFAISVTAIQPGTPEYYISLANVVVLATSLVLSLGLVYYCRELNEVG